MIGFTAHWFSRDQLPLASNQGILVKGSNFLENLSETKVLVFDKTGTLTEGVFEVVAIHHNKLEEKKLLELAALAESASSHPISKSLQKAYGLPLNRDRVKDIHEISGQGVVAKIDDMEVAAGNEKLMKSLNVEAIACRSVGTIVHIAINGEYHGHIVISDRIKAHAKETIRAVKKAGIQKTVMLSGDSRKVAYISSQGGHERRQP